MNHGRPFYMHQRTLYRSTPNVDLEFLQNSFNSVPLDTYFPGNQRYRTTSRVEVTSNGCMLLPKLPLYQPPSVNKLKKYGGILREYEDAPVSLIKSEVFYKLVMEWIGYTNTHPDTFSVHQIRTTGEGLPVPEGRHSDGTLWTGLFVLKRNEIQEQSARTTYWNANNEIIMEDVLQEGELITFEDYWYTHNTTSLVPKKDKSLAYRDVFVFTLPEHGENLKNL